MELDKIAIRKMHVEDLDEVLLIIEASSSLSPWSKNMFIEEILNPLAYCFIIKNEKVPTDQIIGFICFRNIGDESELLNIAVHPQHRQIGIGNKLMQFYLHFCRQVGIKTFHLEVNTSNPSAIHLYRLLSYEPVGLRKKFYDGKSDALIMIKRD